MSRHDESNTVTRRDFLRGAAYGTVGLAMGLEGLASAGQGRPLRPRSLSAKWCWSVMRRP